MTKPNIDSPIVVVIGGGFGGVSAVQALAKAPVNVVLIDKENHHLFQPLLYQVATSVLPTCLMRWLGRFSPTDAEGSEL